MSRQCRTWVREFAAALEEAGIQHWFDMTQLRPGDAWQDKLDDALRRSRTLVVILTPNSVLSPSILFELGAAIGDRKRIIPVVPEEFDLREVPEFIRHYHFLVESSPKEAGRRVVQTLAEAA